MFYGRQVSKEEGAKFASSHGMMFVETSAFTKEGVDFTFEALAEKIMHTPSLWETEEKSKNNLQKLNQEAGKKKKCCA